MAQVKRHARRGRAVHCFADGTGRNTLRLAYSYVTDEKIEPAIKKLGDLIKDEMKETGLA